MTVDVKEEIVPEKRSAFAIEEELRQDPDVALANAPRPPKATHKVDADELVEILNDDTAPGPGPRTATRGSVTKTAVTSALADIDQDATFEEAKAAITWEVYDGTQTINGLAPPAFEAHMRSRDDWPDGGSILLGYIDGQLSMVQPHPPAVQGLSPMSVEEAQTIGRAMFHDGFVLDRRENKLIPLPQAQSSDTLMAAAEDPLDQDVYEVRGMAQDRARAAVINAVRMKIQKG